MSREFFSRDAETVARELLGKILVRKINGKEKKARIVETEAYFGANDPALKYNAEVQKEDAERTVESLKGGVSIYVVKFD